MPPPAAFRQAPPNGANAPERRIPKRFPVRRPARISRGGARGVRIWRAPFVTVEVAQPTGRAVTRPAPRPTRPRASHVADRVPLALSFTQAPCLLGIGLQNKSIDDLTAELNLEARQLLANFNKVIVRLTKFLRGLREAEAETGLGRKRTISDQTLAVSLDEELTKGAKSAHQHLLAKAEGSVAGKGAPEGEYAVPDDDEAWREVLSKTPKGAIPTSVSIPKKRQTIGGQLEGRDQADGAHEGERSHKKKKFGVSKGPAGGKGKGAKGSKRHSS